jgi:hypothetical protein
MAAVELQGLQIQVTSSRCANKPVANETQLRSKISLDLRIQILRYYWILITNF